VTKVQKKENFVLEWSKFLKEVLGNGDFKDKMRTLSYVQTLTSYRNVDVEQQMSQVLTLLQHLNLPRKPKFIVEVIYYRVCHGFRQTK